MTLPDTQHEETLERGPGTRASFVPNICHHSISSYCDQDSSGAAEKQLANKGTIVDSHRQDFHIPGQGRQG